MRQCDSHLPPHGLVVIFLSLMSHPQKAPGNRRFSFLSYPLASSRCRERPCPIFLERKCVTINLISLSDRLQSLEETGCGDPAVLPKILQSWGNAPASYFFHEEELWEQMQRILGLSPDYGAVITYRQMAWMIKELCEDPFHGGDGPGLFVDAVTRLGSAFHDHRPADAPSAASNRRLPLSQRLKGPDRNFKNCLLSLRTQAMARAVDEISGGKPMDYSRFVHENIAVHYVPEDEEKIQVGGVLRLARELNADKAACVYHYLLVLPFTLI